MRIVIDIPDATDDHREDVRIITRSVGQTLGWCRWAEGVSRVVERGELTANWTIET